MAVGDRFSIAIGKDVSLADLRRRKAAKQRKQQELAIKNLNSYQRAKNKDELTKENRFFMALEKVN